MSTSNVTNVQVTDGGLSVLVTFSVNHGKGTRTYEYSSLEAVRGILAGDDPAKWDGVRVDSDGGSASDGGASGSAIGGAIETALTDIAEIGEL